MWYSSSVDVVFLFYFFHSRSVCWKPTYITIIHHATVVWPDEEAWCKVNKAKNFTNLHTNCVFQCLPDEKGRNNGSHAAYCYCCRSRFRFDDMSEPFDNDNELTFNFWPKSLHFFLFFSNIRMALCTYVP